MTYAAGSEIVQELESLVQLAALLLAMLLVLLFVSAGLSSRFL